MRVSGCEAPPPRAMRRQYVGRLEEGNRRSCETAKAFLRLAGRSYQQR